MRRTMLAALILTVAAFAGCRDGGQPPGPFRNALRTVPTRDEAMCTLRVVTIPRTQLYRFERMWKHLDLGAFQGPSREMMTRNGVKLARLDMRFRRQFDEIVEEMRKTANRPEYFRLYEGFEQSFDIGPVFDEDTLFVWSDADSVVGRHFRMVRYRMKLQTEVLRDGLADFRVGWQARTGAGLAKIVSIDPMSVTVTLEEKQSLIVAPADFTGRGLGRAFISGVDEAADQLTFLILTPSVIRKKPNPPEE